MAKLTTSEKREFCACTLEDISVPLSDHCDHQLKAVLSSPGGAGGLHREHGSWLKREIFFSVFSR